VVEETTPIDWSNMGGEALAVKLSSDLFARKNLRFHHLYLP
jgi:hypothetical protein